MFPRRELLQKIASAALLFFVPRSSQSLKLLEDIRPEIQCRQQNR